MCPLTVITITKNSQEDLIKTLNSLKILNHFQLIVVDGSDKKPILKIPKELLNLVNVYIKEKDKNLYDAMNKSFKYIKSTWTIFINSGDLISKNFIEIFQKIKFLESDIVYGNVYFKKEKHNDITIYPVKLKNIDKMMPMCHQSIFYKSLLLKNYQFKIEYNLAADYHQIYSIYKKNHSFRYIDENICEIKRGGLSEIKKKQVYEQWFKIQTRYNSRYLFLIWLFDIYLIFLKRKYFIKILF